MSKIKCKNFAICGNYIPANLVNECQQANGEYLCTDCIARMNKEALEEQKRELLEK